MSDKRIGFIIAGHIGNYPSDETARTIEVLAISREAALRQVAISFPDFTYLALMTESEIRADIDAAKKAQRPGEEGYVVAGFIGDSLTEDTATKIAVSALDEQSASVAAMSLRPGFKPMTALSISHLQTDLSLIADLRKH